MAGEDRGRDRRGGPSTATTYPDISDHGLIGDLQTAALVASDGTIDWFCCPRFDSPSVFASLLDAERGGYFRIRPESDDFVTKQLYLPGTAILITRFMSPAGVGEVIDFMPVVDGTATDQHRLVRLVRVVRGEMRFVGEIQPRFGYGLVDHETTFTADGVCFTSPDLTLTVHRVGAPIGADPSREGALEEDGSGVRLAVTLHAGDVTGIVLESGGAEPRQVEPVELLTTFLETRDFWRNVGGPIDLHRARWREMVTRSAMTLKLMTYAPTGALIAAPTCALPEQIGGERNWDYRYTWIRDASFSVYALLGLGYTEEAEAFVGWLHDRIAESAGDGRALSRSCTGWTARRIWSRRRWSTSRDTAVRARCASATGPPTSSSSTSTARPWTPSTWPTPTGCSCPTTAGCR